LHGASNFCLSADPSGRPRLNGTGVVDATLVVGIPPFRGGIVYEETPCQTGGSMTPSSVTGR
jgi:hypothetical protein